MCHSVSRLIQGLGRDMPHPCGVLGLLILRNDFFTYRDAVALIGEFR